jgi:hypothetical protein
MTHGCYFLRHVLGSPTRAGDGKRCVFCVQRLWEKTCIPTSGSRYLNYPQKSTHNTSHTHFHHQLTTHQATTPPLQGHLLSILTTPPSSTSRNAGLFPHEMHTKSTTLGVLRMCWRSAVVLEAVWKICHPGPVLFFLNRACFRQRALIASIALIAEEYFRVNLSQFVN